MSEEEMNSSTKEHQSPVTTDFFWKKKKVDWGGFGELALFQVWRPQESLYRKHHSEKKCQDKLFWRI